MFMYIYLYLSLNKGYLQNTFINFTIYFMCLYSKLRFGKAIRVYKKNKFINFFLLKNKTSQLLFNKKINWKFERVL